MSVSVTILIIIILVQLIVGLFKLENVNIRKSKTEISGKNNLKLFAVLFTTLSAFCYLLSHHVSGSYPEISNVALILAGSLLTTGIFSILIGFSDFMNYVSHRLREIVVENSYLKTLSRDQQLKFKETIDQQIFGEATIKDPESLYSFINQRVSNALRTPFRREFHNHFYYYNSDLADYWRVENRSSYILYKNGSNNKSIDIPFANDTVFPKNCDKSELKSIKYEIKIGNANFNLKYEKEVYTLVGDGLATNDYNNFPVSVETTEESDRIKKSIRFTIKVPDELFNNNSFIYVKIFREQLYHKSDNIMFLRMTYPTKDVLLSCEMKDGRNYKMDCCAFGFDRQAHILYEAPNSASVNLKEWILSGHGAVISWLPSDAEDKPKS